MAETHEIKVPRAHSYEDIERVKFKTIKVSDDWKQHLGEPELGNCNILVYGRRGKGKTTYLLQLAKMFCQHRQKVHYNTGEEGMKLGFKTALKRGNMKGVSGFAFHKESYAQLTARLSRRKQPRIVFIDSTMYFFRDQKNKEKSFFDFIGKFSNTTFIWVAGEERGEPMGSIAAKILSHDADVVIHVKDFEAIIEKNRFEATEPRIIWQDGYEQAQAKLLRKG